jgi:subtilase family serine protease
VAYRAFNTKINPIVGGISMSFRKLVISALVCAGCLGSAPGFAAEKAVLGARAAANQQVQFDIYLPLQNRAELDTLLVQLQDSTSPNYHKWLKPAEFSARFGASPAKAAAVQQELAAYGLQSQLLSSQHIHVTGDARTVEQLFLTQLKVGTYKDGRKTVVAANGISLPQAMVSSNAVVVGLSGFVRMHKHAIKMGSEPLNRYSADGPYWFTDLKQAYSFPSYKAYTGKGVTIGVLMTGNFNPPDMANYFGHEKLAVPKMSVVNISGGAPYDPNNPFDNAETFLDMQQAGGMAPNASIVLYNIPDLSDANIISGLITILESNNADVVNMSFGGPEIGYLPEFNGGVDMTGILGVYDSVFAQGNAQGITFVASSGDLGSNSVPAPACFEPDATSSCGGFLLSAETPASSPHVTGVGGTNLVTTMVSGSLDSKYVSEAAFGDPLDEDIFYGTPATGGFWGSGGGNSIYYKKPLFQLLSDTGSKFRTVPDVALHMGGCPAGATQPCGPDRSAVVVGIAGAFYGFVGTSASSPDFAGLTALKIERLGTRLGNENFDIYALAALQTLGSPLKVFHQNIPGNNGFYSTKKGYDKVLGNGTVDGVNFLLAPLAPTAGTPQTPSNP